ncbi:Eco57I restriction-modification methylase domain-containing protein [Rufibacter ruber]|uniref:Eco57I restriction-modification methylase domain-containing protein n=1 Tax=Rufibacter ruber TaxID=1783499 RepID=UPI0008308249|nr:N-6 DNA methylase [Rufibacter ruber]
MQEILKQGLENLEMIGDSNHNSGLVSVHEIALNKLSPEEYIALENAKKYKVDFVYFRRFENRPSIPQIFIYDFTARLGVEEQELIQLHKQLYSSALVPMFFVFTKKDIRIFNCFERPSDGNQLKYKPLTIIKLASNISKVISDKAQKEFEAFSARSFDNGTFWENSKYSKYFKFSNSAYEKLLVELKHALRDIIKLKVLPASIARKVMVTSILIRYLEEREDERGRKVFPSDFFQKFVPSGQKFTDIFERKGAYLELLDFLAEHFNGGIFQADTADREFLETADLSRFGLFLEGKAEGLQRVLWKLYSFNDLPVELISNIYEEFLGKQPGVVYTPPFLVNFLLDEAMPLESESTDFKILDPACGSGVFLVGAYRRLIHRWRRNNSWQRPSLETLKKLLKENIYGVELNKDAADLTVFSLSLALCDELTPLQIWEDLKFDNLHEKNILHDDFFNVITSNTFFNTFDLIIGNPPFEASLTPAAKSVEKGAFLLRNEPGLKESLQRRAKYIKLPDNQVSLLFLEQSIKLCKPRGLVCLIQPSGPLLYNNSSAQFRRILFEKYNIPQIIDFTHISRILFGKNGDVATSAIFLKNEEAKNNGVLHITVRRTKPHKEKLYFELDTYDFHHVPRQLALNDPLIWKSNFIGGSRVHQLIKRLSENTSLKEYLDERKEKGWVISEGFTAATKGDIKKLKNLKDNQEVEKYRFFENKLLASFISDKKFLPTKALTVNGIDETQIENEPPVKYFHSTGEEKIYKAPHLLIKELIVGNIIPLDISINELCFQRRIIGVHAPIDDLDSLEELKNRLSKTDIYPFYIAATSGQYLVNKSSAIYKQDIENLPYPEDIEALETSHYESLIINEFNEFLLDFRRNGETSKVATQDATLDDLQGFGQVYCEILGKVYPSIRSHEYFETNSYICYPFYFGDTKPTIDFSDSDDAEGRLEYLVRKNLNVNLRLTRIIRMYEMNIIYLIKPKKLRYWLKSIALRDADETFTDLRKQGY